MADQNKNVFISHVHEDDAGLGKIKDLLAKNGMSIRDSSVNSSNPNEAKSADYIKSGILAPRIQWAGTLLVYISPQTKNSEWVNWEIEYAHKLGKRIVGVWAHGEKDCEVPDALNNFGDAVVGWGGNSIIDAINGTDKSWVDQDGTPCPPRQIKRHCC
tara:strand:+ start:47196 stop:47669 length:474 start_codon:yes stop_codon:yes gene_type:complete